MIKNKNLAALLAVLASAGAPLPAASVAQRAGIVRQADDKQTPVAPTPAQAPTVAQALPTPMMLGRQAAALRYVNNPIPWWLYAGKKTPRYARADRGQFSRGRRA
jgi:hypothetical protein